MPGSTPIFGFPYPDPSDLVANYPALGQQLAEDVEDAIYARKILQITFDTDTTNRTTTSTSFVDVTGMSITITPQKADSAILIWALGFFATSVSATTTRGDFQITDNSNNAISGAQEMGLGAYTISAGVSFGFANNLSLVGRHLPNTTSAVTYKLRFRSTNAATTIQLTNATCTGYLYAIEVSA
jgi:hypothetical protein